MKPLQCLCHNVCTVYFAFLIFMLDGCVLPIPARGWQLLDSVMSDQHTSKEN